MRIAIGPIEGHYGGAAQHIINIMNHSDQKFETIELPQSLKIWGKVFRKSIWPVMKKLPHSYEHSDKRFDMYGAQKFLDIPGILKSRLGLRDYDAVHLHGHPYWEQLYNVSNPNLVYTIHNLYSRDDFPNQWHKTIDMLTENMIKTTRRAKAVISVATWLQEALKSRYGVDSIHIPNGVNLKEFDDRNGETFREKFSIADEFYLFVGRATKYKRPELFVELAKRIPQKRFVMVGRGLTPQNMQKYTGADLPNNLTCIGEPQRKDVVDAFDACNAFVL